MNFAKTVIRGLVAATLVVGIGLIGYIANEYDKQQTAQNFSCEASVIKKDFVIKLIEKQNNSNMLHVAAGEEADMLIDQMNFTNEGGITPVKNAGVSVLVNFIESQKLTTYSFYDKDDFICVTVSVAQPD